MSTMNETVEKLKEQQIYYEHQLDTYKKELHHVGGAKVIIKHLFEEFSKHYDHFLKISRVNSVNCRFCLQNTEKDRISLGDEVEDILRLLWLGRISECVHEICHNEYVLFKLHPESLCQGMPMVTAKLLTNESEWFVMECSTRDANNFLLKRGECLPEMAICSKMAQQCFDILNCEFPVCYEQFLYQDQSLENLSASWLGRKPRNVPQAITFVSSKELIKLFDIAKYEKTSCRFMMCGQDQLDAYLEVIPEKSTSFSVHVGIVDM